MKIELKHFLGLTICLCILFTACKTKNKPEPTDPIVPPTQGTLKINIIPKFNGLPFTFYTDYYNPINQRIQFEVVRFFLTNFYAKKTSGDSVLVTDAFKYDLGIGLTSFTVNLNPNDFTGMSFAFGVDASKNHLDPTLLNPSHPLSYNQANTMHWDWAQGYVFIKCEAKADTSGTGTGSLNQLIAFHTGDDTCYSPTPFLPKIFSISIGNTTTLNLDVDIAKFITSSTDTLDLRVDYLTHYTDFPALAIKISRNVAKSFIFE